MSERKTELKLPPISRETAKKLDSARIGWPYPILEDQEPVTAQDLERNRQFAIQTDEELAEEFRRLQEDSDSKPR